MVANVGKMHLQPVLRRRRFVLRRPLWPHLFMIFFGAGWAVSFDLGVRLYGAEIVTLVGLVLIPWQTLPARFPMLKKILSAYVLWVFAIGLSDIVNGTPPFDSARHMATPIIGAASLVFAVSVLSRKPSALLTFLAATGIAKAMFGDAAYGETFADQSLTWATIEANTNIFKVRIVPFLTPIAVLLACWVGRKSLLHASIVLVITSVGYFLLDTRAVGLLLFLSAIILILIHIGFRPRLNHFIIGAFLTIIVSYIFYVLYVNYTIEYNPQGHNGQQLLRLENPYNPFGLLLQGRSEWMVWPIAFLERPVFGWGSWAEDKDGRFTLLRLVLSEAGVSGSSIWNAERNYIPVHSLIGAAFVWSGLLGVIAALWFLRILLSMGARLPFVNSYLLPAIAFLFIQVLWNYLFSPPQHVRLTFPIALASLILVTSPLFNPISRGDSADHNATNKDLRG